MKPGWMAAMTLTAAGAALATGPCKPTLLVTLENGQLAGGVMLAIAQGTTARIFAQLGIRVVWRTGAPPASLLPCTSAVQIVLDEKTSERFSPEAMAYATVGAAGAAIHVFYIRMLRTHTRELVPVLLGHVFAHEIVHVLEDVARHSAEGVLKAHWRQSDFDDMVRRPLPFAAEDVELIRARFAL